MAPQKILIFLHNGVGGAERISVLIGKMLRNCGYDITFIITLWHTSDSSITDFIPPNFKIIYLPKGSIFKKIRDIYITINKQKPDICFSSILDINNKLLLCKFLTQKVRYIIRSDNYLYTFTPTQRIGISIIYRLADKIIAQTDEMKEEFVNKAHIPRNKIKVLLNPLDIETIENKLANVISPYSHDNVKHYVAVGRFSYQKGFDILIEAFSILVKKRQNIDLYIIGSNTGIYENEYRKVQAVINKNNIQNKVFCLGYKDNPYPYIRYSDCFVLSSRWEGLPNVLLEALYLGTPVAAAKCIPIINRIVNNGKDGFLAENEDSISLAEAMDKAIELGRITSNYNPPSSKEYCSIFTQAKN